MLLLVPNIIESDLITVTIIETFNAAERRARWRKVENPKWGVNNVTPVVL